MKVSHAASVAVAVATLVAGGGASYAAAATDPAEPTRPAQAGPTAPARPAQVDKPAKKPGGKLMSEEQRTQLRTTGHVDIVKTTKRQGQATVLVQRGEITAVSATSITVRSRDGYTHTYAVEAQTNVRSRRSAMAIGELKVGRHARVIARRTDAGDLARRISSRVG